MGIVGGLVDGGRVVVDNYFLDLERRRTCRKVTTATRATSRSLARPFKMGLLQRPRFHRLEALETDILAMTSYIRNYTVEL